MATLKQSGTYDNTIFLFTSDNGPAAEGADLYGRLPGMAAYLAGRDNSYAAMGRKQSSLFYGPYWAQASSAPSRLYKGVVTEGGTHVAAFVTYSGVVRKGMTGNAFAHVMDVVPTILDAARVPVEAKVNGKEVAAIRGRSMLAYLSGRSSLVHKANEPISFELHGQRAVRQGNWKLVWLPKPVGDDGWTLYDLSKDPAEQKDVSAEFPERQRTLIAAWEAFTREVRINDRSDAGH